MELAAQGAVLLKNDRRALPLDDKSVRSLAVIGDAVGDHAKLTGGGSAAVSPSAVVTPLAGLTVRAAGVKIVHARGTLGTGPLPPIPADVLAPAIGAGPGLSASYFGTSDYSGDAAATRTETIVGGEWRQAPPAPGLPRAWSARWTGTLSPPASGPYRFSLAGAGTARLSLDGRPVATLDSQFETIAHCLVDLASGRPVAIQLEYATSAAFVPTLKVGWQAPDPEMLQAAVTAAKASDAAIVFVDDVTTEGSDRATLALPADQDRLIAAVAAANPRTVVVLMTGGPVLMPWLSQVAAVVAGWYPGQEAGRAIAAVLFGDVDPSGRLPVTFPADDHQGPGQSREAFPGDGTTVRYDEGLLVGYRWYDAKGEAPLFAFGHGLSYTTFEYGRLQVTRRPADKRRVDVRVRVTNTGRREGADVVQLYLAFPPSAGEPPRQLRAFSRVVLKPGESRDVAFALDAAALSTWDEATHAQAFPAGGYQVFVGRSSRDLPLHASVPD
jgi:beta-glucosidase